jgi:quinol-cytochrome oxidoreductase complex cytochrome b subunit
MAKGSLSKFLLHLHPRTVPHDSASIYFTWCLGGLSTLAFLVELVTGALLLFHYIPTTSKAYSSIQYITHVAPFGFMVRNIHYWAGQFMVVLVVLHMVRVYATGSYMGPRSFNWLIGVGLLVCVVMVDFTGYLLVWDDRSLWAWTIARNLALETPILGEFLSLALFGPDPVTDGSIARVYAWHIFLWPGIITLLMAWHFWRVRKDGGISRPL